MEREHLESRPVWVCYHDYKGVKWKCNKVRLSKPSSSVNNSGNKKNNFYSIDSAAYNG